MLTSRSNEQSLLKEPSGTDHKKTVCSKVLLTVSNLESKPCYLELTEIQKGYNQAPNKIPSVVHCALPWPCRLTLQAIKVNQASKLKDAACYKSVNAVYKFNIYFIWVVKLEVTLITVSYDCYRASACQSTCLTITSKYVGWSLTMFTCYPLLCLDSCSS